MTTKTKQPYIPAWKRSIPEYVYTSSLLNRGWTPALIKELLIQPGNKTPAKFLKESVMNAEKKELFRKGCTELGIVF